MRFPTFSTPFSFSIQWATFVPVQIPPSAGLNFNSCANFSSCFSFKRDFLPPRDSRGLFLIFFTPSDDNSLDFLRISLFIVITYTYGNCTRFESPPQRDFPKYIPSDR